MAIRIETGPEGRSRAVVDGSMTIYEAAIDKAALLDAVLNSNEMEIDLSSVRQMDTAGLQLLILAKREAINAGKLLRLSGQSAASRDVLDRYNLAGYFGGSIAVSPRAKKKSRRTKSSMSRP